jgi:hypothetical protein
VASLEANKQNRKIVEMTEIKESRFETLPIELIIKILRLIPDRTNVCLVNRLFYEVSCNIERNRHEIAVSCDLVRISLIQQLIRLHLLRFF